VRRNYARRARWSLGLIAAGLLIAAIPAHGGGQEREPVRGHHALPPFGAKVVTEHVPVLPIPGIWKAPARRVVSKEVERKMGFRPPSPKPESCADWKPTPAKKPAPRVVPLPAPVAAKPADVHLRAGRAMLGSADYEGATRQFRLSAIESSDSAAPLVGMALALVATGRDEPAARAIRKAVRREPALLRRSIDVAGEYRDRDEFARILTALEKRAAAVPGNADAKFALAVVRYFDGDRRCAGTFAWFALVTPSDMVADLFLEGARRRWPPEKKPEKPPSTGRREGVEK